MQCESTLRDNEAVPCAWPKDGDDARAAAAADRRREMGGGRSDCRNAWAAAAAFLAQNRGCRSGGRQPMGPYSKFSPYAARALERRLLLLGAHTRAHRYRYYEHRYPPGLPYANLLEMWSAKMESWRSLGAEATGYFGLPNHQGSPPSYSSAGGCRWDTTLAEGSASST